VSGCEIAGGNVEWMIRRILRGFETASRRGAEKGPQLPRPYKHIMAESTSLHTTR